MNLKPIDWQPLLEKYEKETPAELLKFLYHEEGKSMVDIGFIVGVSSNTISKHMRAFDIKRRTLRESRKLRQVKSGHIGRGDLRKKSVK